MSMASEFMALQDVRLDRVDARLGLEDDRHGREHHRTEQERDDQLDEGETRFMAADRSGPARGLRQGLVVLPHRFDSRQKRATRPWSVT
jgi:hypothetical protein